MMPQIVVLRFTTYKNNDLQKLTGRPIMVASCLNTFVLSNSVSIISKVIVTTDP